MDLQGIEYRVHGGGVWRLNALQPSEKRETIVNFPDSFPSLADRGPRPYLWIRTQLEGAEQANRGVRLIVAKLK